MDLEDVNRQFCREQVERIRPAFWLSAAYAMPACQPKLLALYAWLSALEDTVGGTSESHVAEVKLAWWQHELLARDTGSGRHPIVQALLHSGALDSMETPLLSEELSLAAQRVDRPAMVDTKQLWRFVERMGMNQLRLESSLIADEKRIAPFMSDYARLNGLAQLLREAVRSPRPGMWWLPVDLRARHGLSGNASLTGSMMQNLRAVLDAICREALAEEPDWRSVLRWVKSNPATELHHWLIMSCLQARQLRRIARAADQRAFGELVRIRLSDTWCVWKCARTFAAAARRQ